jgi:hypothetical protein
MPARRAAGRVVRWLDPAATPPDRGERPKRAQKNALSAGPAQPIGVED